MDEYGGSQFDSLGMTIRRKRSQSLRRPRPEAQTQALAPLYHESHDLSPLSSFPDSDDFSRLSGNDNIADAYSKEKIFNLSQCMSRCPSAEGDISATKISRNLAGNSVHGDIADDRHGGYCGDLGTTVRGIGSDKKLKKVKLKVGGVTRTIQAKPSSNGPSSSGGSGSGGPAKLARSSEASRSRKLILQEDPDEDLAPFDKRGCVQGASQKGFSEGSLSLGKEDMGRISGKNGSGKQNERSDTVRKSRRVPKKRALDGAYDEEDDDDDEIRYLEKLKTSRTAGLKNLEDDSTKKHGKISALPKGRKYEDTNDVGRIGKDGKKSRSERGAQDTEYEGEEVLSDCDSEGKKKKQRKDFSTAPAESKREVALTTRQKALLSNKDASGASQIEFPNGLPPAPPRKQKEKLTEVEQQLKKAEAAQRRRLQNEKAARESEAEAIRKILGQDSSRKKREDKIKKRQEELAQEKAAAAQMLASSTIRWVMGPSGTIVTFPQEMGLPKIFETEIRSYPPPREKCVGPFCTNPYKYRDSKSRLPLCSLQCYKAIQAKVQTETTC